MFMISSKLNNEIKLKVCFSLTIKFKFTILDYFKYFEHNEFGSKVKGGGLILRLLIIKVRVCKLDN